MPEDITQQLFQRITDPYNLWLVGVTSVFLCYANLVLFLRRFRLFGIYVTMFVEVTKTVLKVFVVFVVFIVGFAIVFFVLFKEQVRSFPYQLHALSCCTFVKRNHKNGAVVTALAFLQCDLGSTPTLNVISGLKSLVFYSAPGALH